LHTSISIVLLMKIFIKMVIAIISLYILVIAMIYLFQDKLIFQSVKLPENYKFKFETLFDEYSINTPDDETINAIHFKTENGKALGLIVYFHGNADNLKRWGKYAVDFTNLGYDVLMIDYRGYGKSTGIPSEKVLYSDAELTWTWAKEKFDFPKWIIYGRSLGAAIATHLAVKVNPDLLGLETPFDDLNGATAAKLIPYRLKYKFSTKDYLDQVKCKKIIFHGTQDWVVPISSAKRLKPLLKEDDQFIIIPKGGHRNLRKFETFHEKLKEFLQQIS